MGVALCIRIAGDPASRILLNAIRVSILRSSLEISTHPQCVYTGGFILCTMLIGDRGACHIRRAFNGVFLHIGNVLGVLAGVGFVLCGGARNRCPSGAVSQGVDLAANLLCRKGAAVVQLLLRKGQAADFCLQLAGGSRVLNAQLVHCLGQGAPDGIFLGFFRSDLLTGGFFFALLCGLQGHFISEAPAEMFFLHLFQLNFLAVIGGVVDLAVVLAQSIPRIVQLGNDLCVAQRLSFDFGAHLNNVLLAVLGVMDSVILFFRPCRASLSAGQG